MPRVLSVEEAARRGAKHEDGTSVKLAQKPIEPVPIKIDAQPINTDPIAAEIGKIATIMRVTLHAQAETINKLVSKPSPSEEVWEFEVVDRDASGRIARIRVSKINQKAEG